MLCWPHSNRSSLSVGAWLFLRDRAVFPCGGQDAGQLLKIAAPRGGDAAPEPARCSPMSSAALEPTVGILLASIPSYLALLFVRGVSYGFPL